MKIKLIDYGYKNKPLRAHYNDAGADVYVCSKNEYGRVRVFPHSSTKIPLGFGLEIPDGYMACVFPRSGLSSKGITCELPPIDSGYRGEIHAIVTNHTGENVFFDDGDRIGQLVVLPMVIADFVDADDLGDSRGVGAFGSTGM